MSSQLKPDQILPINDFGISVLVAAIVSGVLALGIALLVVTNAHAGLYGYLGTAWLFWAFLALGIENKRDQTRLVKLGDWLPLPYDWVMQRVLSGLPKVLLPKSAEQEPMPATGFFSKLDWLTTPRACDNADLRRLVNRPWSWPVMDTAMRLAVIYPLVFALVQWTVTGTATGLGGLTLFPDAIHWAIRWATFSLIVSVILTRILALATSKGVFEKLSMWLVILAFAFAFAFAVAFVFAVAVAGAGAVAVAVAGAGAVAVAVALAVAVAFAVAFAVAVAFAFAGAFAGAVAVAGAVALAFAVLAFASWATQRQVGLLGYATLLLISLIGTFLAAILIPANQPERAMLIVSLALLPQINAIFDWLSYGATIWLLRMGHQKRRLWPLVLGLADVGVALIMFFALSLTLLCTLAIINSNRAEDLVDLTALLVSLKETPSEHLWVFAMVASTLLPTLIHIGIAILSTVTWFPAKIWQSLATSMDAGKSAQLPLVASFGLTLGLALYATLPASLLYSVWWLCWSIGAPLRIGYVETLERILRSLGLI